ncbi:FUSC family protein [Acinetobacter bohemicus]|uniref:FUSC family protein n=1 Tax=unclassified Acinetobacter TaxID=196816 RepID=UPI001167DD72|nr:MULTISPECIES: FUSC family protein [unclassified Acinetobacter]MCO8044376.1 FUSC family protein [Acinetobacter sp. S4397-1]MDM1781005.1 FUSC family protein [Acinetobacter indicus]QKQ70618.1 FUSC family protein [Acinetobacter sp. 10FS3-1]TQR67270.1 FUSC family protein [Acinetobacter sp. RF14B]
MTSSLAPDSENIVRFQTQENIKLQRMNQVTEELERQSHLFIVILGTVIGAILALFVSYHINATAVHFLLLSVLPICLAYLLRKVYIYTLSHS